MKYCAYCGKPIENGQCTCEGALAEQEKSKQVRKKLSKVAIPVIALCLVLSIALVALQYMTAVKLTDFVKIDTYGKSGSGKVSCTIDETALQKYLYPNTDEDMEELDLLEAFEMELQQWEYVDHIKSCVTITPSKEENLSNGDILKIKVEFENEKDYELNETFRGGTIEYTVSDLYEDSKASQTENVSLKTEEKAENQEENKEKPESLPEQYVPTPEDFNKPALTFNAKVDNNGTVQYTTNKNRDGTVTVHNYDNGTETGYTKYSYDGTNIKVVEEETYESETTPEEIYPISFIGKTIGDLRSYYGPEKECGYMDGGIYVLYDGLPPFFTDDVWKIEEITDSCDIHLLIAGQGEPISELLHGSMTYPEIEAALGDKVTLKKPTMELNEYTGRNTASLSFYYEDAHYSWTWFEDPMTSPPSNIRIEDRENYNSRNGF